MWIWVNRSPLQNIRSLTRPKPNTSLAEEKKWKKRTLTYDCWFKGETYLVGVSARSWRPVTQVRQFLLLPHFLFSFFSEFLSFSSEVCSHGSSAWVLVANHNFSIFWNEQFLDCCAIFNRGLFIFWFDMMIFHLFILLNFPLFAARDFGFLLDNDSVKKKKNMAFLLLWCFAMKLFWNKMKRNRISQCWCWFKVKEMFLR